MRAAQSLALMRRKKESMRRMEGRMTQVQALQQHLARQPSLFVRQFALRLGQIWQSFLQQAEGQEGWTDSEPWKAFLHSFQLYDLASVRKLLANYDAGQEWNTLGPLLLKKMGHSLEALPLLLPLTQSEAEREALRDYQTQVQTALALVHHFAQREGEITAPPNWSEFLKARFDLLFLPSYQLYLTLRNRYFIKTLIRYTSHQPFVARLHRLLRPWGLNPRLPLALRLETLDFRELEQLTRRLAPFFPQEPQSSTKAEDWMLEEIIPETTEIQESGEAAPLEHETHEVPSPLHLVRQQEAEAAGLQIAREASGSASEMQQAAEASQLLARSPFEVLCFRYAKELILLAHSTEIVRECSAPFFRAKTEEYLLSTRKLFEHLWGDDHNLYQAFGEFIRQLLQATQRDNPFPPQKEQVALYQRRGQEWNVQGYRDRDREWTLILSAQLPWTLALPQGHQALPIEKGRRFVIQLGIACFDYDQPPPKRSQTLPSGYVKFLLKGRQLKSQSALIYMGHDPFYLLTSGQLIHWRALVWLYLIALRNKYRVDLPEALKAYLVEVLSPALSVLQAPSTGKAPSSLHD